MAHVWDRLCFVRESNYDFGGQPTMSRISISGELKYMFDLQFLAPIVG